MHCWKRESDGHCEMHAVMLPPGQDGAGGGGEGEGEGEGPGPGEGPGEGEGAAPLTESEEKMAVVLERLQKPYAEQSPAGHQTMIGDQRW
jgi:hypothetical protein